MALERKSYRASAIVYFAVGRLSVCFCLYTFIYGHNIFAESFSIERQKYNVIFFFLASSVIGMYCRGKSIRKFCIHL